MVPAARAARQTLARPLNRLINLSSFAKRKPALSEAEGDPCLRAPALTPQGVCITVRVFGFSTPSAKIDQRFPCPPSAVFSTSEFARPMPVSTRSLKTIVCAASLADTAARFLKDSRECAKFATTVAARSMFPGDTLPEPNAIPSRRSHFFTRTPALSPIVLACWAAICTVLIVRIG